MYLMFVRKFVRSQIVFSYQDEGLIKTYGLVKMIENTC